MDMMLMEHHFLRSPLRLYSELDAENNNSNPLLSAAMIEKARALWGAAGIAPGHPILVPSRMPLWAGHWPPPPGLLGPPLPRPPQLTPPPASTPSSSGSPSPRPNTHRYSPYHVQASPARN
ncbi:t-box protein [Nesidiocoris tenuis]|nr:t-box protein [Nesidiocoris tenuis]